MKTKRLLFAILLLMAFNMSSCVVREDRDRDHYHHHHHHDHDDEVIIR